MLQFSTLWPVLGLLLGSNAQSVLYPGFDYPPNVEVWCGKAYNSQNQSFNPGGWLEPPPLSTVPLLDIRVRPRMNLYLASEAHASFVVDAAISYQVGERLLSEGADLGSVATEPFEELLVDVIVDDLEIRLVKGGSIGLNTTGNDLRFSLDKLSACFEPYNVTLTATSCSGTRVFSATTQLHYLPSRNDGGSVVRLDNLYGGLWYQRQHSSTWTPIFPYSFYVLWSTWLEHSVSRLNEFKANGYNIIHIVPDEALSNEAFPWHQFDRYLQRADEIGLYIMYDMRYTYKNLSSVRSQVERLRSHPSLLLWYTGDEPDGATDPLNATSLTYNLIKSIDPYHPVSLCLFCYDFYYRQYASGADVILEDVYPIADNTSYFHVYGTVCNTTYGCCGCDDCTGNFEDISNRLDRLAQYDTWLGRKWKPKTRWAVPQAIGNNTFWSRYPSPSEEVVMAVLSVNHNAKGVVAWDYITKPDLEQVTSGLAKVLTASDVTRMLLGSNAIPLAVRGQERVDAAAWVVDDKVLVSIVNLKYEDQDSSTVVVDLPIKGLRLLDWLWGATAWEVQSTSLSTHGLSGLEVSLLVPQAIS